MKKTILIFALLLPLISLGKEEIETWDYYEITLAGPKNGNPFVDVQIEATFTLGSSVKTVKGFYNGSGIYKIRYMPENTGTWKYVTKSNSKRLNGKKGEFECVPATGNNFGKVEVDKQYHFKYNNGTSFYPFGTTSYAWTSQSDALQELTLKTLSTSPFNKIRMCVFPKTINDFVFEDPLLYAYEGTPPTDWNFDRFNPMFFEHLEKRILQLRDLGIECDLIILHPYDKGRWGFDNMSDDQDDFYIKYLIARLSSFRNIWWSAANEYDAMENKQPEDWGRILQIIKAEDPYQHLSSIHNGHTFYDNTSPLVTHASIQAFTWKTRDWIEQYKKPVIVDECRYEGNIKFTWGDLTAEAMTQQFWDAVTRGGYASHGETYLHPDNIIWWGHGGKLYGKSVERIAFLKKIIAESPRSGLTSFNASPVKWNRLNSVKLDDDYFLFYYGERQHGERDIELPENKKYEIEIIDTWEMTITKVDGLYSGKTTVKLPSKPYIALRVIAKK